ncbi:hypothetical protein AYI70_g9967 [Smittium culicis]|uniref:Retrotransposon gag domain-containing protein n=1 Tax=Smittium culicis TaxID=133412 RepID=A0A1R1X8P7_9FUNG|nr:hypothetical protein AYI70_g9967 [Smittium culicis]
MKANNLEPKIFRGKDDEDAERWIKRYDCFRNTCTWTDEQAIEYLDLFMEGKALMWYKGNVTADTVWIDLKKKFIETFSDEEVESAAWNDLIAYTSEAKDTIEIAGDLTKLFTKANVTSASEKLRFLLRSLNTKQKRKVLTAESKTWESAMIILAKEEKLEKIVNTIPVVPTSVKTIVKEIDPIERLILKFDELSVSLLNKEKNSVLPQDNRNRYYENKCSLCNRVGHKSDTCNIRRNNNYQYSSEKNLDSIKTGHGNLKNVNCIELTEDIPSEKDIFLAEKRNSAHDNSAKQKRVRILEPESINKGEFVLKERPRIQERRPVDIKLSESSSRYSIGNNLAEAKADLSLSQLLQVAPSVRKGLMGLCKRVELKEIGELGIEERTNTNCRGLISIFNDRHWAILDTGAACSVMSESLMISLGLEVDNSDDQIIVTADGTRHNPLGTISKLPIKIANYSFPVDVLVLKINKPLLILGTD